MVIVTGSNISFQYGLETAWGTAVARDTAIGRIVSGNININNNPTRIRGAGAGRTPDATLYGPLDATFNFTQQFHDPQLLKLAIGPRTGSGTSGDPYVLTEASVMSSSGLPPFTLEKSSNSSSDEELALEGCVVNTCTLSFSNTSQPITLSMDGIGETSTDSTASTSYTEPSTTPWTDYQLTVAWGSSPTTIGRVVNGNVTISNNLITNRVTGSRFIQAPELGVLDYSFSLTVLMSETSYQTLKTSLYGGSTSPSTGVSDAKFATTDELKLTLSEGASSGDRNVTIHLDECVLNSVSEPVNGGSSLILVSFNGMAHKGKNNTPVQWWTA